MNRRRLLAGMGLAAAGFSLRHWFVQGTDKPEPAAPVSANSTPPVTLREPAAPAAARNATRDMDQAIRDQLQRIHDFDKDLPGDIFLPEAQQAMLLRVLARMKRIQQHAGHANFSLMSFDEMLRHAHDYSVIGAFSRGETEFMESIFCHDAREYGFRGRKVIDNLTSRVPRRQVVKIPHTGNYLFRDASLEMYRRLKKDIGEDLILTSGIRSIVKQMYLFMDKARKSGFNLSRASRSLAPPGHSYHALGDFDVGRRDLGALNFTDRFAQTPEYRRLIQLGYVSIRYTRDNRFGVRYEPWHIKVV